MAFFRNRNNSILPGEIISTGYGLLYLPAVENDPRGRTGKAMRTSRHNRPRRRRFSLKGLFTF